MQSFEPHLIDRMPQVRGRLKADAPLADQTWFHVGGPAEVLFKPADRQDLIDFINDCDSDIPITVIGVASNLLVRDGGIPGVTIMMRGAMAGYKIEGTLVTAEAAVLDRSLSQAVAQNHLTGMEFLSGIPGTIGGAVFMNAGCYEREIADIIISATVLLPDGSVVDVDKDELGLSYRHSSLPEGAILLDATFQIQPGDEATITARMDEIKAAREDSQPTRARTGGSTFANPEGHKAWKLIDEAGCRGLTIGGAQISEKHCNFMINTGTATAADLEALGEEVRARVKAHSGIDLRWEIQRIGEAL